MLKNWATEGSILRGYQTSAMVLLLCFPLSMTLLCVAHSTSVRALVWRPRMMAAREPMGDDKHNSSADRIFPFIFRLHWYQTKYWTRNTWNLEVMFPYGTPLAEIDSLDFQVKGQRGAVVAGSRSRPSSEVQRNPRDMLGPFDFRPFIFYCCFCLPRAHTRLIWFNVTCHFGWTCEALQ